MSPRPATGSPYRLRAPASDDPAGREGVILTSQRWIKEWCADDAGAYLVVKRHVLFVDAETGRDRLLAELPSDRIGAFAFLAVDETHVYVARPTPAGKNMLVRVPKQGGDEEVVATLPPDFSATTVPQMLVDGDYLYWRTSAPREPAAGEARAPPWSSWVLRVAKLGGAPEVIEGASEPLRARLGSSGRVASRRRPLRSGRGRIVWSTVPSSASIAARVTSRSGLFRPRALVELVHMSVTGDPLSVLAAWELRCDRFPAVAVDSEGVYLVAHEARWIRSPWDDLLFLPAGGEPISLSSWKIARRSDPWTEIRLSRSYVYWRVDQQICRIARRARPEGG